MPNKVFQRTVLASLRSARPAAEHRRYMRSTAPAALVLLALPACAADRATKCSEHPHTLAIKEHGFEHVNHEVLLNDKIVVKELQEAMWFVESVRCTREGFAIVASHVQYNEPTKQEFTLKVTGKSSYELE